MTRNPPVDHIHRSSSHPFDEMEVELTPIEIEYDEMKIQRNYQNAILDYVREWIDSEAQAIAWYENELIPALGGITAQSAVRQGRGEAVMYYLSSFDAGGFA